MLRSPCLAALLLLTTHTGIAQQPPADEATKLLDHLVGRWVMTGTLGGKQTTHDLEAEWVLKREYLRLHEISREKDSSGAPAYEAIVFLSWDKKSNQYTCLWLDNTAQAAGFQPIARGRKNDDSVPLVFKISPRESLHTTFRYERGTDSWQMTIDDVTAGKTDRFGDVRLTHRAK